MSEADTKKPTKRVADPELQVMAKVDSLLAALDEPQQWRVLAWLQDRYGRPTNIRGMKDQE